MKFFSMLGGKKFACAVCNGKRKPEELVKCDNQDKPEHLVCDNCTSPIRNLTKSQQAKFRGSNHMGARICSTCLRELNTAVMAAKTS